MPRNTILFNIYGRNINSVNKARKDMQQLMKKEYTEKLYNTAMDIVTIAKLTPSHIAQMQSLAKRLHVKVTINSTSARPFVHIQGSLAGMAEATVKISDIFREVEYTATTAKQVQWMYLQNNTFVDYPADINSLLENAYDANEQPASWKDGDVTYTVDFGNMVVTNNRNHQVQVKRSVIGPDTINLPKNWSEMADNEIVKLEKLLMDSIEYQQVESAFMNTAGDSVQGIQTIERVQNPTLYRQYVLRSEEIHNRCGTLTERHLWHGASAEALSNINSGGFNRSYCGTNATDYGEGVYFAVEASYSADISKAIQDADGTKRVYDALVLIGDYTAGQPGVRFLPDNPNRPGSKFDTAVDDINNPNLFVIFHDNQAYPNYLITFS